MGRVLPILFNTDMVRAILEGRKTVTRRVVKPYNAKKAKDNEYCQGNGLWVDPSVDNGDHEGHIKDYSISPCWISWSYYIEKYAPCRPGDILYVRETLRTISASSTGWCKIEYRAGGTEEFDEIVALPIRKGRWCPSIHMPKAAARIWLKVTDVRVERLKDISGEEILKEGIEKSLLFDGNVRNAFNKFAELWDSTIKKVDLATYGWDANPWVWIIEFERCEKPEELKGCQGFPKDYIIDRDYTGKSYPRNQQVAKIGNSVCPPIPAALVRANLPELCRGKRMPNMRIEAEETGQLRFA